MSTGLQTRIEVRRANERHHHDLDWLQSHNSFDTGVEPSGDDFHHGVLIVNNDDTVRAGTGFDTHPHRDTEIVTWVLGGSLVHQDSTGHNGVVYPGLAQRMTAGTGILHSERNDAWPFGGGEAHSDPVHFIRHSDPVHLIRHSDPVHFIRHSDPVHLIQHSDPVHFIQMWVRPDESGLRPGYEQLEIDGELLGGGLVTVASGMAAHRETTAIRLGSSHAALHVARLRPGLPVYLPQAPYLHVYVARGSVELEGAGELNEGDAVRTTASGGQRVSSAGPAEVLVWEMDATLG